jgi:hypothetical protein
MPEYLNQRREQDGFLGGEWLFNYVWIQNCLPPAGNVENV